MGQAKTPGMSMPTQAPSMKLPGNSNTGGSGAAMSKFRAASQSGGSGGGGGAMLKPDYASIMSGKDAALNHAADAAAIAGNHDHVSHLVSKMSR
jgi:uncharacterized spore protein YtfJ